MTSELRHILCIDDENDILEVVQMCLETVAGCRVTTLSSAVDALAKIDSIAPDLILLDVMMPEMDGPSALKKLRERKEFDHIPVVFMTARVRPPEIQFYIDMGAAGVVSKPFDPMQLARQIADIWTQVKR